MKPYTTIYERSEYIFEDRKSKFIGEAAPVATEAEALEFIASVKKRYPDARHHVYAYVLRENSIMRFTDDREPQGTAGLPVLDIIRKNNCTDTVIVVTRYFGGTLLGTGGLVHAYTEAAKGALLGGRIVTYNVRCEYSVELTYSDYQKVSAELSSLKFTVKDTDYSSAVTVVGSLLVEDSDNFEKRVTEITAARAKIIKIGEFFGF